MDEEYVPYEQSLELEQLGFDEYCMHACYYEWNNGGVTHILLHTPDSYDSQEGVTAPLYSQAFRWFREKYGLHQHIEYVNVADRYEGWVSGIMFDCKTYEEAELACLKKLIKIVKNK